MCKTHHVSVLILQVSMVTYLTSWLYKSWNRHYTPALWKGHIVLLFCVCANIHLVLFMMYLPVSFYLGFNSFRDTIIKLHKLVQHSVIICFLFVLRFYSPVNPMGSCRARSVYLTTRLLGERLTSIVHILSPETDNCPSWISGRERMTVDLFVLRFYGPVNPMGSCRARSVYLTTRLLGRLSPQSG